MNWIRVYRSPIIMALLRFLGATLAFGGLFAALMALIVGAWYGFGFEHPWLGVLCVAGLGIWYWVAMGRRNPAEPEDFKDFGV